MNVKYLNFVKTCYHECNKLDILNMSHLLQIQPQDLPDKWKYQILSFQRIVWTEGFFGELHGRDWITRKEDHPLHFIIVEGNLLISHLEVVWRYLEHNSITYKVMGVTGVLTFPDFRKQGHGKSLILEATKYIENSDADIGMFSCEDKNLEFYKKCGWGNLEHAPITMTGSKDNPHKTDSPNLLFKPLTKKGEDGKKDFENIQLFFEDDTW
jgi:GNAT superfamily N-acetyltransferase